MGSLIEELQTRETAAAESVRELKVQARLVIAARTACQGWRNADQCRPDEPGPRRRPVVLADDHQSETPADHRLC